MPEEIKGVLLSICALFFLLGGVLLAGTIARPTDVPQPTFYTLEDIYNKLTDSDYTTEPNHGLSTDIFTTTSSMYSLADIFSAIPDHQSLDNATSTIAPGIYSTTTLAEVETDLLPENIATGTELFGIIGTFECAP
jgi:hypothetical protein